MIDIEMIAMSFEGSTCKLKATPVLSSQWRAIAVGFEHLPYDHQTAYCWYD